MNQLALAIRNLTVRNPTEITGAITNLSEAEQKAIERLCPLLRLSTDELAAFIQEQQAAGDWGAPPPLEESNAG